MDIVQEQAAKIVSQVMEGRNLNQLLKEVIKKHPTFTPQEKGALQDLSYGTIRWYGKLLNIQNQLVKKPIQNSRLQNIILVALYQLQYSKAAHYAVVDHAVRAGKKIKTEAAGLVNAVLRNYLRKQSELVCTAEKTEESRYSYTKWWISKINTEYKLLASAILDAGNQHPPMILRVNKRFQSAEQYLLKLTSLGMQAEILSTNAIKINSPVHVEKLPGFQLGEVSVQDLGAQYAAELLEVQDGMRVLDACAAPGGKTSHILENWNVELVAIDNDEQRLGRVKENLLRLKLEAKLIKSDAKNPKDWWDGIAFNRILADVPCSGSGVVRRHPDIKWLRRSSDIEAFAEQQEQILEELWPLLAKGGKLLYATCSVFARENQEVVGAFISRHQDSKQIGISVDDMKNGQLIPNDRHDGFFYALLQKNTDF